MWDTAVHSPGAPGTFQHLSRDLPCPRCHHGVHTYLSCGEGCDCPPVRLPGHSSE